MPPPRAQRSAPFAARELNGETLLEELEGLRAAGVSPDEVDACADELRRLGKLRPADASLRIRALALERSSSQPAVASLLVRWATRLRAEGDLPELIGHLERLAIVGALLGVLEPDPGEAR